MGFPSGSSWMENRHIMKLVEPILAATMTQRSEPTADQPQKMFLDQGYDYPKVREFLAGGGHTGHTWRRGKERGDTGTIPGYRPRRIRPEKSESRSELGG